MNRRKFLSKFNRSILGIFGLGSINIITTATFLQSCSEDEPVSDPQPNQIELINNTFTPNSYTVTVGTTLTWINRDDKTHSVNGGSFNSGDLNQGDTYQLTLNTVGTYNYKCDYHGGMSGSITVTEPTNILGPDQLSYSATTLTGTSGEANSSGLPSINDNGVAVAYSRQISPSTDEISIDIITGEIKWTSNLVAGVYLIKVTATNINGTTSTDIKLEIATVNGIPSSLHFEGSTTLEGVEDTAGNSSTPSLVSATSVSFSISNSPTPPNGVSISSTSGVVSWDDSLTIGSYNFAVIATNSEGSSSTSISLNIVEDTTKLTLFPVLEHANNGKGSSYTLETLEVVETSHNFSTTGSMTSAALALRTTSLNTQTYGGPIIKVTKGDTVSFNIKNSISTPTSDLKNTISTTNTTNHWHGLHIIGQIDGTPHQNITSGDTWSINMKIQQEASTNWYHSHTHGITQQLVNKGHVGMFIIDDENSNALNLPNTTNIDDFPIIAKHQSFNNDGTIDLTGFSGATKMLANGREGTTLKVEKKWIRIRLLNGSDGASSEALTFNLSDNSTFYKIATEGGFLDRPVAVTSSTMAPAERNEFLIDFTGRNVGDILGFMATPNNLNNESSSTLFTFQVVQKKATTPAGVTVNTGADLRGSNNSSKINWPAVKTNANQLLQNPTIDISFIVNGISAGVHSITYEGLASNNTGTTEDVLTTTPTSYAKALVGVHNNNTPQTMDMEVSNFSVKKNMWQVWNFKSANHPLHIHGCSFLPLTINGIDTPEEDRGWKDVIFPTQGGTDSKFLVKFDYHTFSDIVTTSQNPSYSTAHTTASYGNIGSIGSNHTIADYDPYMIHCHFLNHEDEGMMGQFNVVPLEQTI